MQYQREFVSVRVRYDLPEPLFVQLSVEILYPEECSEENNKRLNPIQVNVNKAEQEFGSKSHKWERNYNGEPKIKFSFHRLFPQTNQLLR